VTTARLADACAPIQDGLTALLASGIVHPTRTTPSITPFTIEETTRDQP
jgi:hypothetical protein